MDYAEKLQSTMGIDILGLGVLVLVLSRFGVPWLLGGGIALLLAARLRFTKGRMCLCVRNVLPGTAPKKAQ
jgi:hypothetical protein